MIPTKKIFHLLLIISDFILVVIMMNLFVYGIKLRYDKYNIFWICSKIITINKLLEESKQISPLYIENITSLKSFEDLINLKNNNNIWNSSYIDLLNKNNECSNETINCGKLDSFGHYLCISKGEICPINEIKYNEGGELNNTFELTLDKNYTLYFNNKTTGKDSENKILVYFYKGNPQYINEQNFIFDEKLFKELFNENNNSKKYTNFNDYKNKKMNEEENKDTDATVIISNANITFYYKNFIGFGSLKDMDLLMDKKKTLLKLYKLDFPNLPSTIISIFCFVIFLILMIFSLIKFFSKERQKKFKKNPDLISKIVISGIYLLVFIGYFVYFVYICVIMNENHNCSKLKKIKADKFIVNNIKEVCNKIILQKIIIIVELFFLCISLILFIISFFIEKLYILILRLRGKKFELQWLRLEKKYKLSN